MDAAPRTVAAAGRSEGGVMHAEVGDRIVIRGHRVGEHERDAEILEVHGKDGGPPYVVRWSTDGQEGLFFPGPDAEIAHRKRPRRTTKART